MHEDDRVEILLVEDDPADAELSLRALQRHRLHNRVPQVTDGVSALDFIFGGGAYEGRKGAIAPRLVLLDLHLPKVDGMFVLTAVRADARTRTTPVVLLTSSRAERDLVEGYRRGANSHVRKPVRFDEFIGAVAHFAMGPCSISRRRNTCIHRCASVTRSRPAALARS